MSFAFIILFFALLIWIKAFIHDRISRFVLLSFVAYWCFALFSSTLSPLGLFPISDGTYGVLTLGVLSFVFGMSIVSTNSETKLNTYDLTQIKTIFNKTLSSRILICVYIIFTLIALKYSTKALIISALQGSASEMAAERETLIFEENYWVSQAYTYLMFPLFNFASMAIAYIIMYQLKGHRLMLSILLCYAATFSILAAGRSQFMVILLYFLIVFVCMERGKAILSVNSKQLKRIVMIGLLAVGLYIGMSYMTNFRRTGELQNSETAADSQMDSNMAETILSYSTLPLRLFDIALNEDYLTRLGGYRYGRCFAACRHRRRIILGNRILSPGYLGAGFFDHLGQLRLHRTVLSLHGFRHLGCILLSLPFRHGIPIRDPPIQPHPFRTDARSDRHLLFHDAAFSVHLLFYKTLDRSVYHSVNHLAP